jgi:S1-C subfamily serine protease
MRPAWVLAALLVLPGVAAGQPAATLRVTAALNDAARTPVPVARHALLISDNPSTSEPRRVLTGLDGSVTVRLRPGSYTVESDRPYPFLGQAYQWTQIVDVAAGRETALALTAENAEIVPWTAAPAAGGPPPDRDPSVLYGKWQESVVAVWSPTSRGSGFVVDARGLIATDRHVVGSATSVEVQLSPTVKVPARALSADAARDVAILLVDPGAVSGRAPVPLPCPPAAAPALDDGREIVALAAPLRMQADVVRGEVTALNPRTLETDLRLSFGSAGGPVFDGTGAVVGLTSAPAPLEPGRRRDVNLVRAVTVCEAVTAARAELARTAAPEPTRLPVEPTRAFPVEGGGSGQPARPGGSTSGLPPAVPAALDPPVVSSSDFDIALITPPMVSRAQQRAEWSGGKSGRSPEAEARIGRLTEFAAWSDYFEDRPAVLIVRVTPKMVEGFWKRLGREAARTQGAVLPAFKDFKGDFLRLRVSCGAADVTPIHPFVLEHRVSEKDVVREGLYVFDPGALGPHCGPITLSVSSEKTPGKADQVTLPAQVVERLWEDFAPYRAAVPEP